VRASRIAPFAINSANQRSQDILPPQTWGLPPSPGWQYDGVDLEKRKLPVKASVVLPSACPTRVDKTFCTNRKIGEMMSGDCDFGLIGLAVMGENLALNVESRGYKVAVFNRTTSKVDE
jgi:hypothetical protein